MSRISYTEEDRKIVFERDGRCCNRCHRPLVFKNRKPGLRGAWNMGHSKAHALGGSDKLRYINALCWECNNKQKMTSSTVEDRKYDYDSKLDKAKNYFNNEWLPNIAQFDLSKSRRSKTREAELHDFRQKIKPFSNEQALKLYRKYYPNAHRFLTTQESGYEIYYQKCMIIQEEFNLK